MEWKCSLRKASLKWSEFSHDSPLYLEPKAQERQLKRSPLNVLKGHLSGLWPLFHFSIKKMT